MEGSGGAHMGMWDREKQAQSPLSLLSTLPPGPHPQTRAPVPNKDHLPPCRSPLVPRGSSAPRPRPHPEGHPLPRSQDPRAEWLPFLPVSICRNWGHPTSTVSPSAEEGQQLMLSQSPSQPAKTISSIRQGASAGQGPPTACHHSQHSGLLGVPIRH